MHLNTQLTRNIEIGALRTDGQDGLEVIPTDGGKEVRNSSVSAEPRMWEVALPPCDTGNDTADYDAVRQLWKDSERGLHTFNFYCFVDDEVCKVRFASPLQIRGPAGHLRHIETFMLREELD
jgi:hypothetical protein